MAYMELELVKDLRNSDDGEVKLWLKEVDEQKGADVENNWGPNGKLRTMSKSKADKLAGILVEVVELTAGRLYIEQCGCRIPANSDGKVLLIDEDDYMEKFS